MNRYEDRQTPEYLNNTQYRQEQLAQAENARLAQQARDNQSATNPMRSALGGLGKQMVSLGTRLQALSEDVNGTSQQLRPEW